MPSWHIIRRAYDWTVGWAYRPSSKFALGMLAFAESSFFPIPPDVLLIPLALANRRNWFQYALLCTLSSAAGAVAGFLIGWLLWTTSVMYLVTLIVAVLALPAALHLLGRRGLPGRLGAGGLALAAGLAVGWAVASFAYQGTVEQFCYQFIPSFDHETYVKVSELYERYNFWIVFAAAFTPIPFKVITVTAGVFGTGGQVASPAGFFAMFVLASLIGRGSRFFLVAGLMRLFGARAMPFIEKYFNLLALLFTALLIGGFAAIKYLL